SLAVADMYLLGWVDKEKSETKGLKVPGGLSFLLHYDTKTPVKGLEAFPPEDRPTALNAIFQFYHLMVVIGMALIALSLVGLWYWWRGRLFDQRWLLRLFVLAVLLPQIANQVGWFA
ncbi:cytochrome ubiquinol oxidase subunit I, partial [Arthrospira platensis SPKY1]|nr:cytochrome ubiquinol oxidase subunit I [Arthrospira platensis SPKY1]